MRIDTTINVNVDNIKVLSDAVRATGLTRGYIVSWLLHRMVVEEALRPVVWKRVRYQDRNLKENWGRLHLSLTPAEYELFLDLKKLYKLSGSRIIAFAVETYIEKLYILPNKNLDNYRFTNYTFSRLCINGTTCLFQTWGIPLYIIPCRRNGHVRSMHFMDSG
jgi:hypothetical protein